MIIHSKRIYTENGCKAGYLVIEDGKIKNILREDADVKADVDYGDMRIIPGIFDTHNHGGFGYNLMGETTEEAVKGYLKGIASQGVTNVFPTSTNINTIALLAKMSEEEQDGAKIVGIHSEGPWGARVGEKGVNTGYPKVDMEVAKKMIEAGKGKFRLIGIAPEVEGAIEAIEYFVAQGVMVAAYHTNATYAEANIGIDHGITVATHLGNVMTGLHHRDVGTMGAALLRDEVDCELICDGMHVSLPMVQLVLKMKDNDRIMMISDNVHYAGAPVGKYRGMNADPKSDRKTLTITEDGFVLSESGRLSGSSKPVLFGIQNLVEKLNIPLEKVIRLSSYNPCRKYGMVDRKGSILSGKDADLVVIDDNYQAVATYSEGRKIFDCKVDKDLFNKEFLATYKLD